MHPPTPRRLYLIDAKAQVYRLSHGYGDAANSGAAAAAAAAVGATATSSSSSAQPYAGAGEESSLVAHGFVQILLSLFNHKPPPTHMAVVVDAPGATFRCGSVLQGGRPHQRRALLSSVLCIRKTIAAAA